MSSSGGARRDVLAAFVERPVIPGALLEPRSAPRSAILRSDLLLLFYVISVLPILLLPYPETRMSGGSKSCSEKVRTLDVHVAPFDSSSELLQCPRAHYRCLRE